MTMNEPANICGRGFGQNVWAPGQNKGEAGKYLCNHYSNLAHGSVVQHARKKYPSKDFKFGMPIILEAGVPASENFHDVNASIRMMDNQAQLNWGPITSGDCTIAITFIRSGNS